MKMYTVTYMWAENKRTEEIPAGSVKEAIEILTQTLKQKYGATEMEKAGFRIIDVKQSR